MSLRMLGISASPRGEGNSFYLLGKALKATKKIIPDLNITVYTFEKKTFAGCLHCYGCRKKGTCIVQDDFQDLADRWMVADMIIYSVPVYHMSIPGQLKCFLDRLGQSRMPQLVPSSNQTGMTKLLKPIGIISQGMHIFSGQERAVSELVHHALLMGCLPIAGDLWESYLGASGWTEGLRDKDAIKERFDRRSISALAAVTAAETLGKNVAHLARIVEAGRRALQSKGDRQSS